MTKPRNTTAKTMKNDMNAASNVIQKLPEPLPKITTDEALWHRLLRTVDYAVQQHVQGFTPGPRPRVADPGWEDLEELQSVVAGKLSQVE